MLVHVLGVRGLEVVHHLCTPTPLVLDFRLVAVICCEVRYRRARLRQHTSAYVSIRQHFRLVAVICCEIRYRRARLGSDAFVARVLA